jgi:hypothetical protein
MTTNFPILNLPLAYDVSNKNYDWYDVITSLSQLKVLFKIRET